MNPTVPNELSQTPYLVRALWEWCSDAGLSPQILVRVDDTVRVPRAFVVDGRIVLDISSEATNQLELGNEWITFQARFGTKVENIEIPLNRVEAIFAEETGQGMGFEIDSGDAMLSAPLAEDDSSHDDAGSDDHETAVPAEQDAAERIKSSPLKLVD